MTGEGIPPGSLEVRWVRPDGLSPEQAAEFEAALRECLAEWDGKYEILPAPGTDDLLAEVAEGKTSANAARKALGLPAWPVPEFGEAREIP